MHFNFSEKFSTSPDMVEGLVYDVLRESDTDQMVDCIINTFAKDDPLSLAAGLSPLDLKAFIINVILNDCLASGCSIVARDVEKNIIAGAVLISDFGDESEPDISLLPENFMPIVMILGALEDQLRNDREIKKGELLHVIMGGVRLEYMKKGLLQNLLAKGSVLAKKSGFTGAFSEATGRISQFVAAKVGSKVLYEIKYSEFDFDGRKPFFPISGEGSCKLVFIEL